MLLGYARVSKADGSQVLDLQRDALLEAGVHAEHIYADQASGQGDRIILTRLPFLSHSVCFTALTKTLHERRRAQVRASGTDWVYTPAWWGRLRGSAARRHEPAHLAPALPHWPPCCRSWTQAIV
jgi:hypothetical protein